MAQFMQRTEGQVLESTRRCDMVDEVLELLQKKIDRQIDESKIEIVPDEQIINVFAVRTGDGNDYLVNTLLGAVEHVRFPQWPPR
jgi:hypothetical protein